MSWRSMEASHRPLAGAASSKSSWALRLGWLHEALAAPVLGVFTVLTGLFIDACWTRGRHAGNLHEI